jgi:hypothetical protein
MPVTKHLPEEGYSVVGFDGTAIPKRRSRSELGAAVTWMTLDGPTERPKSAP